MEHSDFSYAIAWDSCITISFVKGLPEPLLRDVEQATILRSFCVLIYNNVRAGAVPLSHPCHQAHTDLTDRTDLKHLSIPVHREAA